jgi:hypothetical protein
MSDLAGHEMRRQAAMRAERFDSFVNPETKLVGRVLGAHAVWQV